MEVKKYSKPEVKNKRLDFFLLGLSMSLGVVLFAFTYRQPPVKVAEVENIIIEEDLVVMENTVQEKKPPPPPPPPEIEVVEDDEEIEEDQPEIEDTEIDQDTEIAEYEEEEEEPEETNEVFEIFDVSEKAAFPGGDEGLQRFIAENITYPPMALENDMQGTVNVMFVVDKQGRVKDIAILGGKKGFGLEDEAMRVIKMTSGRWSPAKQRDKAVNMRFRIPVKFQIF
ncbi:energy transducer TonB [Bacteroidia bacterium]|jgi:protein TonB|nr:energy transducer TonB [Bacteroidota bacterium]MDB4174391.1 energy transducer TonB [Bacteroidia bacterium]